MRRVYIEYKIEYGLFDAPELHTLELEVPSDLPLTLNTRWAAQIVRDKLTRKNLKFNGRVEIINIIVGHPEVAATTANIDPTVTQSDGRMLNLTLF